MLTMPLRLIFHRVGVYVTTIFAGAFAFGIGFDVGITKFWDKWNEGVSTRASVSHASTKWTNVWQKQWKDIRHKYVQE